MLDIIITIIKVIAFFLGWAVCISILIKPKESPKNPALWRLWAEIAPFFVTVILTLIFWLIEKRSIKLHLFGDPVRGIILGTTTGILWLAIPVFIMYITKTLKFDGVNTVSLFFVWVFSSFLNVVMQELLVHGYLYQMIKQDYNIIPAVIVTTLLFTALHGGAFEAGVIPVLNVLTMNLLMIAVLEYSGSLIAPIIMHFLWNTVGALVLGGVSLADDYPSLLKATFSGKKLISGGKCKIEGSVIVTVVNILLIALFMSLIRATAPVIS